MFKRFIALAILVFLGVATYVIGSRLSADAIGMAVGIMFGIMAGIPTALLFMASNRRQQEYHEPPAQQTPPPIVILSGPSRSPDRWIEGPATIDAPARSLSWAQVDDW